MPIAMRKQESPLKTAVKEKLPAPLQGLLESDPVSDLAPTPIAAAGTALTIPMQVMNDYLASSRAADLIKKTGKVVQDFYRVNHNWSGSDELAGLVSGTRRSPNYKPERVFTVDDPTGRIPGPYWRNMDADPPLPKKAVREASDQVYEITQEALGDLGVGAGRELNLYRSGPVDPRPYLLTPSHIDESTVAGFSYPRGSHNRFEVPKESIQAMVGLLRQGDAITRGEMLVPSHRMQKSFKEALGESRGLDVREVLGVNQVSGQRIPSWFKQLMMKER